MKGMHCHSLLAEAEKAVQELDMGVSLEREQIQEVGAKKLAKIASQAHGYLTGKDDPWSHHEDQQKTNQRF